MTKVQRISAFWLLLAVAAMGFATTPSVGLERGEDISLLPDEQRLADTIDRARLERGLAALELDPALAELSRTHTKEMIQFDYLNPVSPAAGSPLERTQAAWISDCGSSAFVAKGQSQDDIQAMLMSDNGFQHAIFDQATTHFGLGILSDDENQLVATVHFLKRVVDFNRVLGEAEVMIGENTPHYTETHTGSSRHEFLRFDVYEGSDLDVGKRQSSRELTTDNDGTFSLTFDSYRHGDYYLAVWAKDTSPAEYELVNLIRISPISPIQPGTEPKPTDRPTLKPHGQSGK